MLLYDDKINIIVYNRYKPDVFEHKTNFGLIFRKGKQTTFDSCWRIFWNDDMFNFNVIVGIERDNSKHKMVCIAYILAKYNHDYFFYTLTVYKHECKFLNIIYYNRFKRGKSTHMQTETIHYYTAENSNSILLEKVCTNGILWLSGVYEFSSTFSANYKIKCKIFSFKARSEKNYRNDQNENMYDKSNPTEERETRYLYDYSEPEPYDEENYYDGTYCHLYKK